MAQNRFSYRKFTIIIANIIANIIAKNIIVNCILLLCALLAACQRFDPTTIILEIPPKVLSVTPADKSAAIVINGSILIEFSHNMLKDSVEDAFSLNPGNIAGEFTWTSDTQAEFRPGAHLAQATAYTIRITTDATNQYNIHMAETFTATFSTLTFPQIMAGENFTAALKSDSTIVTWGGNEAMQLGNGTIYSSLTPVLVTGVEAALKIAVGTQSKHTLAIVTDGSLFAWGYNFYNQLGLGPDYAGTNQGSPKTVSNPDNVLGKVIATACGSQHSLALNADGTVLAWGNNANGELGLANSQYNSSNTNVPVVVAGLNNISAIACGADFSAALAEDGTLWLWGSNIYGQLGFSPATSKTDIPTQLVGLSNVIAISCGSSHCIAIVAESETLHTVYTWGDNYYEQLGRLTPTITDFNPEKVTGFWQAIKTSGGFSHTLILTDANEVYGWGSNENNRIGASTSEERIVRVPIENVIDLCAGKNHSAAIKADGTVWTWGDNSANQLGRSDTSVIIGQVPDLDLNGES